MTSLETLLAGLKSEIKAYLKANAPGADESPLRVPLNAPSFNEDEIAEALHSMLTQKVTMGDKVAHFETAFAEYLGVRHAVMVNSGSSANLLAMAALANPLCAKPYRLAAGAEVIVPAVTWPTTLWPVINLGLVPVLVDARPDTLCIDPEQVRAAISPKTRAIFVAHILGNAADMPALQAIARQHDLVLIEDTCESLGTRLNGRFAGRFSTLATYSFFFSHHITTIEGGMVITDDDDLADLLRCLRSHGWSRHMRQRHLVESQHPDIDPRFLFVNVGYNLRPTDLQAGFGLHQLTKLDGFNKQRQGIARMMASQLAPMADHLALPIAGPGVDHTWFGFPVTLTARHSGRRRDFVRHLETHGIETRPIIAGNLARQPALQHFAHRVIGDLAHAQAIMERGVYWGIHPYMTERHVHHVASAVRTFFEPHRATSV